MSNEHPGVGEVDPTHVGPPDLILREIVALQDVPEAVRNRVETIAQRGARRRGEIPANVTFAGRALAFVEGTDQMDYDDDGNPFVWIFALRADSPVLGEAIVSAGGFASSSSETRYSVGEPPQRSRRVSFFATIRTEPRAVCIDLSLERE